MSPWRWCKILQGCKNLIPKLTFYYTYSIVTESGDLAARRSKVNKEANCWKGKFALFQRLATGLGEGRLLSKGRLPHWQSVAKSFYTPREGATCRNSRVSSDSHLEIGHAVVCSASSWLSIVNLQFQGRFVPISLRPVLRIVAAYVMLQPGHHVVNFFHLVRVSVSTRQLTGYGSEYYLQPLRRN